MDDMPSYKGGVLLPYKDNEQNKQLVFEYLANSTVTVLNRGLYGEVIKCELSKDASTLTSHFKKMVPSAEYGSPVTELVLKLCLIREHKIRYEEINMITVSEDAFQNEINIQTDIFMKTCGYLQPLCPAIVYADIYESANVTKWISAEAFAISKALPPQLAWWADTFGPDEEHNQFAIDEKLRLGVIAMEMVGRSATLSNIVRLHPGSAPIYNNMALYALLYLALDTGYNHNDFHQGNILVMRDNHYFAGSNFRAILIDFGRTTKIPPENMAAIRDHVAHKRFGQALNELCHTATTHATILPTNLKYNWVCGYVDGKYHGQFSINSLIDAREAEINQNVATMDRLHAGNPVKYPLLPLSNQIKNQLYNGINVEPSTNAALYETTITDTTDDSISGGSKRRRKTHYQRTQRHRHYRCKQHKRRSKSRRIKFNRRKSVQRAHLMRKI